MRHRQQIHVFYIIVREVRDRTKRRFPFFLAYQQRHRAVAKQHRLHHERRIQTHFVKRDVVDLVLTPHSRQFAKAEILTVHQRSDVRRVGFRHQYQGEFVRIRRKIPLRHFDRF